MIDKTTATDGRGEKAAGKAAASSPDRAQEFAARALEKIKSLQLRPTPQLYELWFRYYQGDAELSRAINQHQGQLDEISCHKLYKRYLSDTAHEDAVRKISDQIQQAVSHMVEMLKSAKTATSEYGTELDSVSEKVKSAESIEDLGSIVSVIVDDTRKMMEKNQALELQLVNSSQQVTELRRNLDNVKKEAMMDGLTNLYNRKAFDKHIREAIDDAQSTGLPLTMLMLDIDHFKTFNDTFGHQVGDQVLRLVARTLTDGVKGRDIAARYGGEEFAIILPETPLQAGVKVGEALRRNVESKQVVNRVNNQHLGQITLSAGVAEYVAGESIADFITRADKALYESKRLGRNRVTTAR